MHDRPSLGNITVPFDDKGELDEAAFRRHIRYMSDAGTGLFVGGPHATEFTSMDRTERRRLWELSVDENKGKGPIYAIPLGPGSTKEMIGTFKMAKEMGFDGAQLYPAAQDGRGADGVFQEEAELYFRDILESVDLPIFLCGYHGGEIIDGPNKQVSPAMLGRLVDDYPHIVGVTSMTRDDDALKELMDAIGGRKPVRLAGAMDWFQKMELGVYGFHSIQQSIAPRLCSSMMESYHAGDKKRAQELSDKLRELNEIVHTHEYYYPRSIKPVLNHLGFKFGIIRRPYLPLSPDVQREIRHRIDELDLKSIEALP